MKQEEMNRIAKDAGRLAAWRGKTHLPSGFEGSLLLQPEWEAGVAEQVQIMRDEAGKIPLIFKDQVNARGEIRAD